MDPDTVAASAASAAPWCVYPSSDPKAAKEPRVSTLRQRRLRPVSAEATYDTYQPGVDLSNLLGIVLESASPEETATNGQSSALDDTARIGIDSSFLRAMAGEGYDDAPDDWGDEFLTINRGFLSIDQAQLSSSPSHPRSTGTALDAHVTANADDVAMKGVDEPSSDGQVQQTSQPIDAEARGPENMAGIYRERQWQGSFHALGSVPFGADYGSGASTAAGHGVQDGSKDAESSRTGGAAQQSATPGGSSGGAESSHTSRRAHRRALHGSANWGKRLVEVMREKDRMERVGPTEGSPRSAETAADTRLVHQDTSENPLGEAESSQMALALIRERESRERRERSILQLQAFTLELINMMRPFATTPANLNPPIPPPHLRARFVQFSKTIYTILRSIPPIPPDQTAQAAVDPRASTSVPGYIYVDVRPSPLTTQSAPRDRTPSGFFDDDEETRPGPTFVVPGYFDKYAEDLASDAEREMAGIRRRREMLNERVEAQAKLEQQVQDALQSKKHQDAADRGV